MTGFLTSLFRPRPAQPAALSLTDANEWRTLGIVRDSAAGVSVTPDSALRYTAVFACVRVLAESVASLPLIMYRRVGDVKERARDFHLYRLLHDQPNPLMTSFELRETMMGHVLTWGNAYAEMEIDGMGRVVALWPLSPAKMQNVELSNGEMIYTYQLPKGGMSKLPGWRVFHLRGLGGDGLMGYSPIGLMRQAVGLGLAAEEFGARFFGNGARPSGVLEHPGVLGDEAHKHLRASWNETHGGLSNSHRVAILEEGLHYNQIGIPPEDAQFLETRQFQRSEIASMYRVPPHMIADLEHATFSNIEHQAIEFVTHSLRPWLVKWEQGINTRLLSTMEQEEFYAEFLVDALLRGEILSRYQAYGVGIQNGFMTRNQARVAENWNPLPGLDEPLLPLNMIPADQVGQEQAADMGVPTLAANAHYRLLAEEAAGRVVRKEIAAMNKAAKSPDDFEDAVTTFYRGHGDFVAQTMRIDPAVAGRFAADGRDELLDFGPDIMGDWSSRRVQTLARLATGEIT